MSLQIHAFADQMPPEGEPITAFFCNNKTARWPKHWRAFSRVSLKAKGLEIDRETGLVDVGGYLCSHWAAGTISAQILVEEMEIQTTA